MSADPADVHARTVTGGLLMPQTVRRIELHEAHAHAHGERTVTDLGDAILLRDAVLRDPFLNRVSGLRLPIDRADYATRMLELLSTFAAIDRRPHFWLSPGFTSPPDLAGRLLGDGFMDLGGTFTMVLDGAAGPAWAGADTSRSPDTSHGRGLPAATRIERVSTAGDRRAAVLDGAALVMVDAFGAGSESRAQVLDDLARPPDGRWDTCLVSVGDEPVAAGRRYTADGLTYLSSIGTRPAWWGRGLGTLVTQALAADGARAGGTLVHLGVDWQNARAMRLYRRLGFAILGDRMADLLLA
jgi:ribosomal protein S18 acetylase RimI-like enzyme